MGTQDEREMLWQLEGRGQCQGKRHGDPIMFVVYSASSTKAEELY